MYRIWLFARSDMLFLSSAALKRLVYNLNLRTETVAELGNCGRNTLQISLSLDRSCTFYGTAKNVC